MHSKNSFHQTCNMHVSILYRPHNYRSLKREILRLMHSTATDMLTTERLWLLTHGGHECKMQGSLGQECALLVVLQFRSFALQEININIEVCMQKYLMTNLVIHQRGSILCIAVIIMFLTELPLPLDT